MLKNYRAVFVGLAVFGAGLSLEGCASMDTPSATLASTAAIFKANAQGADLIAAAAPNGYVEFCRHEPTECGAPAPREPAAEPPGLSADEGTGWLVLASYPISPAPEPPSVETSSFGAVEPATRARPHPAGLVMPSAPGAFDWSSAFAYLDAGAAGSLAQEAQAPTVADPALLERVNREVNASIRPEADEAAYGREDYWTLPLQSGTRVGDCKDYVLEKRRALIEAGVPAEALSIAVVRTVRGKPHAVLLATTAKGVVMLDSASPWVSSWDHSDYALIERQVFGHPLTWVAPAFG